MTRASSGGENETLQVTWVRDSIVVVVVQITVAMVGIALPNYRPFKHGRRVLFVIFQRGNLSRP